MLGRILNVIFGCILSAAGAYTLFLQFMSSEPTRSFILFMGSALLVAGAFCLWAGLRPRPN